MGLRAGFRRRIIRILERNLSVLRMGMRYKTSPLGVPADLKSGVKKCPNLFRLCGFAIRSKEVCFSFCWGITNPPVFNRSNLFLRRSCKSAGTESGDMDVVGRCLHLVDLPEF